MLTYPGFVFCGDLEALVIRRLISAIQYRAEIDGLRAVAVGIVVLFHAELGIRGGFVGVDVFFVISGYLITNLIMCDLRTGSFSITKFWERRIRRILPALNLMVFGVLITGWFLLLPPAFEELAKSTFWQALLVSNLFFWRNTGYFAGAADEKPLLHTWSLAVEEQFYLIVPILLLLFWSWKKHRRLLIAVFFGGLTIFGFLLSVYGVSFHPSAAFYLLPFRAWELALGATVACFPLPWLRMKRWVAEFICWTGILAVLGAAFFLNKTTPFPGFWALLPCAGTAAIIWVSGQQETSLRKILSLGPVVFVGLISYSLYLWHWPFFSMARYWALEPISITEKLFLVAGSLFVSVLSYYFVEQPFRQKKILPSRRGLFLWSGATTSGLLLVASLIAHSGGVPTRINPAAAVYATAVGEKAFIYEVTTKQIQAGAIPQLGKQGGKTSVLLWGDSHAMALAPAVDESLKKFAISGQMVTHSSTAPLINFTRITEYGLNKNAIQYSRAVLQHIAREKIPHVILSAHWNAYPPNPESAESGKLDEQILKTVKALRNAGAQPWIVLSVPVHKASIPKVLLRASLLGENPRKYLAEPNGEWNGLSSSEKEIVRRVHGEGAKIIDPRRAFLDETGKKYIIEYGDRPLYRDEQHLTPYGAQEKLAPLLIQIMGPDLSRLKGVEKVVN